MLSSAYLTIPPLFLCSYPCYRRVCTATSVCVVPCERVSGASGKGTRRLLEKEEMPGKKRGGEHAKGFVVKPAKIKSKAAFQGTIGRRQGVKDRKVFDPATPAMSKTPDYLSPEKKKGKLLLQENRSNLVMPSKFSAMVAARTAAVSSMTTVSIDGKAVHIATSPRVGHNPPHDLSANTANGGAGSSSNVVHQPLGSPVRRMKRAMRFVTQNTCVTQRVAVDVGTSTRIIIPCFEGMTTVMDLLETVRQRFPEHQVYGLSLEGKSLDLDVFVSEAVGSESILVAASKETIIPGVIAAQDSDGQWREESLAPCIVEDPVRNSESECALPASHPSSPLRGLHISPVVPAGAVPCEDEGGEGARHQRMDAYEGIGKGRSQKVHAGPSTDLPGITSPGPSDPGTPVEMMSPASKAFLSNTLFPLQPHTPDRSLLEYRAGSNVRPQALIVPSTNDQHENGGAAEEPRPTVMEVSKWDKPPISPVTPAPQPFTPTRSSAEKDPVPPSPSTMSNLPSPLSVKSSPVSPSREAVELASPSSIISRSIKDSGAMSTLVRNRLLQRIVSLSGRGAITKSQEEYLNMLIGSNDGIPSTNTATSEENLTTAMSPMKKEKITPRPPETVETNQLPSPSSETTSLKGSRKLKYVNNTKQ